MLEYELMPTLKLNSTLSEVKILQEKLKILNYYVGSITGSFGITTEDAVKRFQFDYDLDPTGIVDNETWSLLFKLTPSLFPEVFRLSRPTLRLGSTGEYVMLLQNQLSSLFYYNGQINGTFDKTLEDAVKRFQYINKLTSDGIVGKDTWSALVYLYSPLANCQGSDPDLNKPPLNQETYIVQKGDTLWSIANKFNTTVDNLKTLNNLTSDNLSVGQKLKISDTTITPPDINLDTYIVKKGDTLWSIANNYGLSVDQLKTLNNLTNDNLNIGQSLYVPKTSKEEYSEYIVVKGDTLWSIANKFNTNVETLKIINKLNNNLLSIGQKLYIPKTTVENLEHTVTKGDTLWSIANKYSTTVDKIKELNNLTTNLLSIGQVLKIPK